MSSSPFLRGSWHEEKKSLTGSSELSCRRTLLLIEMFYQTWDNLSKNVYIVFISKNSVCIVTSSLFISVLSRFFRFPLTLGKLVRLQVLVIQAARGDSSPMYTIMQAWMASLVSHKGCNDPLLRSRKPKLTTIENISTRRAMLLVQPPIAYLLAFCLSNGDYPWISPNVSDDTFFPYHPTDPSAT